MVLNLALVWHLAHVGLALATSLSAFLNAGLLFLGLRKDGVLILSAGWGKILMQVFFALLTMGLMLHWLVPDMSFWLGEGFAVRLGYMLLICAGGAVIYAAALFVTGINLRQLVR